VDVVATLAAEAIILVEGSVMGASVEAIGALIELELAIALAQSEAALGWQHEADFRVEVGDHHLAVHCGNQGLPRVDIGEVEGE
jgi:hypothetical protein